MILLVPLGVILAYALSIWRMVKPVKRTTSLYVIYADPVMPLNQTWMSPVGQTLTASQMASLIGMANNSLAAGIGSQYQYLANQSQAQQQRLQQELFRQLQARPTIRLYAPTDWPNDQTSS